MLIPLASLAGLSLAGAAWERLARRRDRARPLPGRLIDVGTHRLHFTDEGSGSPTVVLLHGAGDCSFSWGPVRRELAQFTRVVTYDRPGLGASDVRPLNLAADPVEELRVLLERAAVPGPYVLLGHSLGGLLARLFAARHPELVAGFVFVDSTHEQLKDDKKFRQGFAMVGGLLRVMRALSPLGLPRALGAVGVHPMYPERGEFVAQLSPDERAAWEARVYRNFADLGAAEEFRTVFELLDEASRLLPADGSLQLGDKPVAVVSNPGFGEGWTAMQRELSTRSSRGTHVVSDRKGHNVQMRRPELVVKAVREVVEALR